MEEISSFSHTSGDSGLPARLDGEIDEFMTEMLEKNKDYQYQGGYVGSNLEEEMENCPMFMTKPPTQEQIDSNPALAAIQALKYENEDPYEAASAYKEDGNYHFKCKAYKKAIKAYQEGINKKCDDNELTAVLYSNRAAAHYYLGNLRSSLLDATEAVKYKPNHMKAIFRGAQCCFELRKYKECLQWCDDGLQVNPKDKKLLDLRKRSLLEMKKVERDRRRKEHEEKQRAAKKQALMAAVKERGISVVGKPLSRNEESSDDEAEEEVPMPPSTSAADGHHVYLDQDGALHWPVFILMPEANQSDLIQDFYENDCFQDHFKVMFRDDPPFWDIKRKYCLDTIQLYFESSKSQSLVRVDPARTLREVLSDQRYTVNGESPTFVVLPTVSDFTREILSSTCVERF